MLMSNVSKILSFLPSFFQFLFCLCFCVNIRQDAQLFLCLQWTSGSSKEPLLLWTAMPHTTPESSSGSQRPPSPHAHCLAVVFGCRKYGMHHCCSFRWDRDGEPVLTTSGGRVSVRHGSLTISQTWSGDIGDYTCTVTSAAGNDSHTARLEVMWVHENNLSSINYFVSIISIFFCVCVCVRGVSRGVMTACLTLQQPLTLIKK